MKLRSFVALAALLGLSACDSEESPSASPDATTATETTASDASATDAKTQDATAQDATTQDATAQDTASDTAVAPAGLCGGLYQTVADVKGGANTLLDSGSYAMAIYAKAFDLQLSFRVDLVAEGSPATGGKLLAFVMRAVSTDGWVSDPIASACNVAIAKDGSFQMKFDKIVMPGKATPTGTDVELKLELNGKLQGNKGFCGDIGGSVPAFEADLAGSTFKGVPKGQEKSPAEASCESAMKKQFAPIAQCPALQVGKNVVKSGEIERTFQLLLPGDATPTEALPLVFLFHGVGGSSKGILDETQFASLHKSNKFILVVPDSATIDGKKLTTDWYYAGLQFDTDNRDLVFFDDMVTCVSKAMPVDAKRIYVTGMSGGGLMSTFAAVHRSKVIAAAAPFSGGYLHTFPKNIEKLPVLVTWGGPTDAAYKQNFDLLAKNLIGNLVAGGHFTAQCEHTTGHKWPLAMNDAAWAFLSGHTLGSDAKPFAAGLSKAFPAYCKLSK